MATTKITGTGLGLPTADGVALGGASNEWSDLYLADSSVIYFGNDQDVTVTHDPDDGLIVKSIATADNNPLVLTLQTGETDMAADDVIGKIAFQAPDEGTGTDAILVSAAIQARAEGNHSSSSNATSLDFMTGASEAAAKKMSITSGGDVNVLTDGASLFFGADSEVELRHVADSGFIFKNLATADNSTCLLTFQTGETDMAADDVMGKIAFQAPDVGTGTDAVLIAAAIQAVSIGDFSSSSNATRLEFMTGNSEAAVSQMALSTGTLDLTNTTTAPNLKMGISDAIAGVNEDYATITVQGTNSASSTFDAGQIVFEHDDASAGNRRGAISLKTANGPDALAEALRINYAGEITKPKQPAFQAIPASNQLNISINAYTTIVFGTERFDVGANFATPNFTAPVTGKYWLGVDLYLTNIDSDANYYNLYIETSNKQYGFTWSVLALDQDANYWQGAVSTFCDMDASDTAYIRMYQSGGTSQTDIDAVQSHFAGYLVA